MNPTLELIHYRRSTRNYAAIPVTREEKDTILQAAMRAPTAGNMMLYSIIEVDDQGLKDRLAISCDDQPFIAKAPFVLLFVADYQRWMDLFEFSGAPAKRSKEGAQPRTPQEGDLLLACCDALIAAQTAVLAAESSGIGSCYIGDILENYETHRDLFHLPQYTLPITLVCFGRPKGVKEESRPTQRFDPQFIISKNQYNQLDGPNLVEMMRTNAQERFPDLPLDEGVKTIATNMYTRKFISDFSVEMSRSVRLWIDRWSGK